MLKTIEEWNDHFDNKIGDYTRIKYSFNKSMETLKYYVFINGAIGIYWSKRYIEWMDENYPDIEHGSTGYMGYCSDSEIIFMFNNEEAAIAFKLRWI